MEWRKISAMNSIANDYSSLKWTVTLASILTTLVAITLVLSFRSDSWFTFELIQTNNASEFSNATRYSHILEYGSVSLWKLCIGRFSDVDVKCDAWTQETRPHSFNVIIALISCAMVISNLTVFPSWGTSILIVYNLNNQYIRQIVAFLGILIFLTFSFSATLMIALLLAFLTPFYSPGKFVINTEHLFFHYGQGLVYTSFASSLALISLILVISTLIWKKVIDVKLHQIEQELLRQLSQESYQPGWHKTVIAPRTPPIKPNSIPAKPLPPPPYES